MAPRPCSLVLFPFVALAACQVGEPAAARVLTPAEPVPVAAAAGGAAPPAAPAAREPFGERLGLRVGGLVATSFDTSATLSLRSLDTGTEFSFERDLGVADDSSSFRVDAYWRFDRRNRIDIGYFDLSRSGSRTIEREIEWGEVTFPVSATVSSFLDTTIIPVRYTHSFLATRDLDVGLGLGVYYMQLDTGLSSSGGSGASQSFDTPLPLPVFALNAAWEFVPRLQVVGLVQALYVDLEGIGEIENLRGSIVDATLSLEWAALDNLGLGAGVNYFGIETDTATERLEFDFDYSYTALFVYLVVEL